MRKYLLEFIVFVCGAVVMILELDGSRILAPFFGNSLVIWTSLIGIILGSLSIGYYWGGKFADRISDYKTFSLIIFISAIAVFLIAPIKSAVLVFAMNLGDMRVGAILSALILFAPASILLGMISPYAAKLKLKDMNNSGATVGTLYAISTIGSIVGTFSAGFFLIPYFGNTKIIILLSLILLIVSILAFLKNMIVPKILIVLVIGYFLFFGNFFNQFPLIKVLADRDSQYNRLIVYEDNDRITGRPTRNLMTDPYGTQSAMFTDKDDGLVFSYAKYYFLAEHFNPGFKKSMLVGGGAYSFAKEYLRKYKDAHLDVVEIDPEFTNLARQYFNLKDDPRLTIYEEDGRTFINKTNNKYDVIYMDAFGSALSIPAHLTTAETIKRLYDILNDNGVVLSNLISAIDGDKGKFLRAQYYTYKKYFPYVYIFPVINKKNGEMAQNIVLVASKSKIEPSLESKNVELNKYLNNVWGKTIAFDLPILTDDYAPVDQYVLKILN
jgi:spermidine synthase